MGPAQLVVSLQVGATGHLLLCESQNQIIVMKIENYNNDRERGRKTEGESAHYKKYVDP